MPMRSANPTPYFIYDALRRLKEHASKMDSEELAAVKARIALNAADPTAVALFADLDGDDWAHIYPPEPEPEQPETIEAIDRFLTEYGNIQPGEEELLEKLIFNPIPDYASQLEAEEKAASGGQPAAEDLSAIAEALQPEPASADAAFVIEDTFVEKKPKAEEKPEKAPEPQVTAKPRQPQGSLSESLAKIFIKQGRYERAYEIIYDLNLKNPEKSVYFADQLRFLQKLIELQRKRAATRTQ